MANPTLVADADSLTIWLLDMGTEQYGDCIVCRRGDRTILIDGGHPGDFEDRNGFKSIPNQLAAILNKQPPFDIDLLIVTHCHRDHIGCLPALVENGVLNIARALVADETFGFGHIDDAGPRDASDAVAQLAAALREEDHSNLPGAELDEFLADAATLEEKYNGMLARLKQAGTPIVRYGRNSHASIETAFKDFGLKILGPTKNHLEICSRAIAGFTDLAADLIRKRPGDIDAGDIADLYRSAVSQSDASAALASDKAGKGAALNDQSIVLKLTVNGQTALLGGDMQFAKPEISGLNAAMTTLRKKVKAAAPYTFIKTLHHTSYNGLDDSLLDDWAATHAFAHSGGINDATHPDEGALQKLELRKAHLQYARTDRNGLIKVSFTAAGARMKPSRGTLDDFTPNGDVIGQPEEPREASAAAAEGGLERSLASSGGLTEVSGSARVGPEVSRVTMTFDLDRGSSATRTETRLTDPRRPPARGRSSTPVPSSAAAPGRLASGRALPQLLFVTYRPRLENNVGSAEAAAALKLITGAGQQLLEVRNQNSPYGEIRRALSRGYEGVVIVGGYDVLPAQRLDVLPPSLRNQLGSTTSDADNFIVWNDEVYGDRDGDALPDLPMSRIPDAKSPKLLVAALTAAAAGTATRFGVRNAARPFAYGPYGLVAGTAPIVVSEPKGPSDIGSGNANGAWVYIMLHGSDVDATRFWGEDQEGTIEAMNITNIPRASSGVVFAGCCWGALSVQATASHAGSGAPLGVRTPGTSIALSYLHAGARAFVGCTGTHYSPTIAPYRYFGGPMHSAFWNRIKAGSAPARALFDAKLEYLQNMPHGQTSAVAQAIEFKILKQFTCLGLGW
jgi:beta-lactamase superfamily II metal-dependent hydrolase